MKMLMNVRIPPDSFNEHVRDGSIGKLIADIVEDAKPESVYFTEFEGNRGCMMIIEVENASEVPRFAEPWFLKFEAECEFRILMTPEDLERAGLETLGDKWG